MATEVSLIVQVARGGAVDRRFAADPPPSLASRRVAIDRIPAGPDQRLGPPEAGEVVMSVPSPEALTRERQEVGDVVARADGDEPPVIVVAAAEELREDELAVVLDAARRADRQVILRVMSDA